MMCILLLIMLGNLDVTGNNMKKKPFDPDRTNCVMRSRKITQRCAGVDYAFQDGHVDISNLVIGITSNCPSLKAQ